MLVNLIFENIKKGIDQTEEQFLSLLKESSDVYYTTSSPILKDDEFDWVKNTFIKKFGYTPTFGTKKQLSKGFAKERHEIPMGSLEEFDITKNIEEEINKWIKKYSKEDSYCTSEKADGLSVSVRFEKGKLIQALTRGDGSEGDDITENVKKMQGIIPELPISFSGFLRGEIVLLKSTYRKHFSDLANERNAAVGITKRINGEGCEHLTVLFYKVYTKEHNFTTETECLDFIKNTLKLKTPRYFKVSLEVLLALHKRYEKEVRDKVDYLLDGLVVNIDSIERQKEILENEMLPEYARKFKFESEKVETELLKVHLQVGRTGAITPLAILEPVVCGGTLISKATLHNFDEIERLGVEAGDIVALCRSKDVIPKIVGVVRKNDYSTKINPPTKCPVCETPVQKEDTIYYCRNEECGARTSKALMHWLNILNIKNMGEKILEALIDAGKLKSIPDFYKLTLEDISTLERQGEKNAIKILREINDKRVISIPELLAGVNIRNLSIKRAESLEDNFGTLENILNVKIANLLEIDGFDTNLATYVVTGLASKKNLIAEILTHIKIKPKISGGKLADKNFCFSGFRDDSLESQIKKNGGRIASGVSKKLDYLVVRNKNSSTEKIKKAREYGTKIIEPDDLNALINNALF